MKKGLRYKRAQKLLDAKLATEGSAQDKQMIRVDRFLNQALDIKLLEQIGRAFGEAFSDRPVDKILTVEASGIAIAFATAQAMKKTAIFAKKSHSLNVTGSVLECQVYSYTRQNFYPLVLSKTLIKPGDRILLVDDFLARGEAMRGLIRLVKQAEAEVVGVAVAIEKSFQGGSAKIRNEGYEVCSIIDFD